MIIITIGITTDSYIVIMFVDSSLERLGCRHADCAIQPLGVSDGGFRVEGLERSRTRSNLVAGLVILKERLEGSL